MKEISVHPRPPFKQIIVLHPFAHHHRKPPANSSGILTKSQSFQTIVCAPDASSEADSHTLRIVRRFRSWTTRKYNRQQIHHALPVKYGTAVIKQPLCEGFFGKQRAAAGANNPIKAHTHPVQAQKKGHSRGTQSFFGNNDACLVIFGRWLWS